MPARQVNLGYMLERGLGCAKDERRAVDLYRRAAESGNVQGMTNLGVCYGTARVIAPIII